MAIGLLPGFLLLPSGRRTGEKPWRDVVPPGSRSAQLLTLPKESGPKILVPHGSFRISLKVFLAFKLR